LRDIIQSRLEEIFEEVKKSLTKSRINVFMLSNIVLTGGVTSIIGIDKLATEIFEKNTRIGYPNNLDLNASEIMNPTHACSIGMLVFLKNLHQKEKIKDEFESKSNWLTRFIEKIAAI
jgi:cell division protein FtsA